METQCITKPAVGEPRAETLKTIHNFLERSKQEVQQAERQTESELRFRPVTPDTLPLINSILQTGSSRTCDYSIGGIFMWVNRFDYQYCVYRNTLFLKGVNENNRLQTAFSLPIGPLPLEESVNLIRRYCRDHGIRPVFSAIPEDRIDYLLSVADGDIEELEDWADYLYDARQLAELSGKKFNKKRNHVNRFLAENPHFQFEPLSASLLPEVLLFHTGMHVAQENDTEAAIYEKDECTQVLNRYNSYPFEGAVLRDESGEICAYTCGETIGDTLYIHIEKMNHEIAGSGETINKLFADYMTHRHPSLRYINREEDCGDPGLRHAKESYNPVMRLRKFNLYL